jgi:hypothetical protein
VKEYYFYLDSTPTHSYMKYLYKYPHRAYPYDELVATNRGRRRHEMEYELLDTGVFDQNRYFDVVVEYAKASPEDILVRLTAHNRGPEAAILHLLPTIWFRNTWSWGPSRTERPLLRQLRSGLIEASHPELGRRFLHADNGPALLFTENETNIARLVQAPNRTPFVKDGIHNYLVHGQAGAVNPERTGTKAAAHYRLEIKGGGAATVRLRLSDDEAPDPALGGAFGKTFDAVLATRRKEADEFYASVIPRPSVPTSAT